MFFPFSQHKSIVLHNVSDRLMFSLSRRQQQHAQVQLQTTQLGGGSLNNTFSSTGHSHTSSGLFSSPPPSHAPANEVNVNYPNNTGNFQGLMSPTFQSPHSALPASAANTPVLVYPTITAQPSRAPPQQQQPQQAVSSAPAPASGGILKNAPTRGQSNAAPKARSPKNQTSGQAQSSFQQSGQRSAPVPPLAFNQQQQQQQQQYAPSSAQSQGQSGQSQGQPAYYQQQQHPPSQAYTPLADPYAQHRPPLQQVQQQQPQQNFSQNQRQQEVQRSFAEQQRQQQQQQQLQQQRYSASEEKEYSHDEEVP